MGIEKKRNPNNLRCHVCRLEFSRSDSLNRHLKSHSKNRLECPFRSLTECQRTFYRIDDLKAHLEYHNDPKYKSAAFSCDICNRVFMSSSQLEKHKAAHPKPKFNIFCKLCSKAFRNHHALRVHPCLARKAKNAKISASLKKHHLQ